MNNEYQIKKIDSKYFDKLIPLMHDAFGMSIDLDYFKWKFLANPAGSFIGYIAVHKESEEVAAYYGVIPEKYITDNNSTKIYYQSCDTMTHSNHRRKGLFKKLALKCFEDLKKENKLYIYGFGGETSTPGFLKMGWENYSFFSTLFIPSFLCFKKAQSVFKSEKLTPQLIEFISNNNNQKRGTRKILDADYLNWKFKNPLFQYEFMWNEFGNTIDSILIYKIENDKLIIIEIIGDNKNSIKKLVLETKSIVKKQNLKGVIYYIDIRLTYKFIKFGFFFNPFKFGPFSTKIPFITLMQTKNHDWMPSMLEHDAI
jgi:hypothetical protein